VTLHGPALASVGLALGFGGAQLAGGILHSLLFDTRTTDPASMAGAALLLAAAAVACLAPARRAARVAPGEGLRAE
jgi:ABC-type lipoprotein release transport system permease subunit